MSEPTTKRRGRGFASMDAEQRRQISSAGGKAAHEKGTGHEWNADSAREAGLKGGAISAGRRRAAAQAGGR